MRKNRSFKVVVLALLAVMFVGILTSCGSTGKHESIEAKSVEFTEFMLENRADSDADEFVGMEYMSSDVSSSQLTAAKRAAKKLAEAYAEYEASLGEAMTCDIQVYGVYDRADTESIKDVLLELVFTSEKASETYKFVRLAVEDKNGELLITEFKLSSDYIFTTPSKKINKFLDIFVNRDGYLDVLKGLENTVIISVVGLIIGIVIGTLIATVRVIPKYKLLPRLLNSVCSFYVGFFRGTPMAVQLLLFYYVLFPLFNIPLTPVDVSILVFGLNSGAYISEIMRSGIQSVDGGQMEAGRAVGLSFAVTMMKIVIPQAVKNILPTLGNEFIALIKETSVVSFVGATNLYTAFNMIGSNSYEFMVPFLAMAVVYIALIMLITLGIKIMERWLQKSDRRN